MNVKIKLIIRLTLLVGLIGCASKGSNLAKSNLSSGDVASSHSLAEPENILQEPLEIKEPTGSVTLREAVALVLVKNPELATFSWEIRAREARILQAGLLPNPEITTEFQNVGGSGTYNGTNRAESTIQLSQLIELGGKRSKRKRVSFISRDLAWWDYKTKRLDVLTNATKSFIDVLAAQERLFLNKELVHLAEQVFDTVLERVKAGKVSPVEKIKAGVALSMTRIKWERAKRDMESALKRLAAAWGSSSPVFKKAQGNLYNIPSIQPLEQLVDSISKNPDIARWAAEMEKRRAAVEFEDSKKISNLTLSGGIRHFNDTSDNAFILGVSIPIPLFNRNQGSSMEARHKLAKAEKEQNASELRVRTSLVTAYQTLSTIHTEAMTLKNDILPGAGKAFDAVKEGFRFGKFSFLNVLDSQRTLFEAKSQHIEALTAFHKAVADMERLTGKGMEEIKNTKEPELKGDLQ
tara:strand:+ start:4053 stop:5447 length:1395 start_codon:yes stop_codon:yes gene_type:complete